MKSKRLIGNVYFIIFIAFSCNSPIDETFKENLKISGNWQFEKVMIDGDFLYATDGFEPFTYNSALWWPWFSFRYHNDMSYEFRSDLIDAFDIAYGYNANYQPHYGFWELSEDESSLIHNRGMPYEKVYKIIELNDSLFIREYEHIIYNLILESDKERWQEGDTVIYTEVLVKR